MIEWVEQWQWWLAGGSVLFFFGSLIVVPLVIIYLPADYLQRESALFKQTPLIGWPLILLKNLLGSVFLLAGLVMLVTPGQGVLSILVGLSLLNFPGKRKLESRILKNPRVAKAINGLRAKAKRPPLIGTERLKSGAEPPL